LDIIEQILEMRNYFVEKKYQSLM